MLQTLVQPTHLQLFALGVRDGSDAYLRGGRHLRWLPNPILGFPRSGFRLRRRSAANWPWGKRRDVWRVTLSQHLPPDQRDRWASAFDLDGAEATQGAGLRVHDVADASSWSPDGLPLNPPVRLSFRTGRDVPTYRPACWVALQVTSRDPNALITATATARAGDGRSDTVVARRQVRFGSLPGWDGYADDPNRALLLNGSIIDEVSLSGPPDTSVVNVWWLDIVEYATSPGWGEAGHFLLPIAGDGLTYPRQPDADHLARERVHGAAPLALPPWEESNWPPPRASAATVRDRLDRRYLDHLPQLQNLLADVLARELSESRPQGKILLPNADDLRSDQGERASLAVPAVQALLANALDPWLAHLLGLATVDEAPGIPADAELDYQVSALWPTLWHAWTAARDQARPDLAAPLRGHLVPPLYGFKEEDAGSGPAGFFRIVSVATAVALGTPRAVDPPAGLRVRLDPEPGKTPVAASAHVSWNADGAGPLDVPVRIGTTLRRIDGRGDLSLARSDATTGLPLLSLEGRGAGGRVDRELRVPGPTRYRVSAMDFWGRWSRFAEAETGVRDVVPPPPPTGVEARLHGEPDAQGRFPACLVSFDWTAGQQELAPDTTRFLVDLYPGRADTETILQPQGTQVEVAWPALAATAPFRVGAEPLEAPGAGHRVTVTIPEAVTLADGYRRELSCVVRAVDEAGNHSPPSRRVVATYVDPAVPDVPPGEPGIQLSTWPDADETGWWRATWPQQPAGTRIQVMRADQTRLLVLAHSVPADFDSLDQPTQAAELRRLAVRYPHAFSPDHPGSYPSTGSDGEAERSHQVGIPSAIRGLTVVVVVPTGPTGSRAPWPTEPDAFTVVGARRLVRPAPPVLRAERDGDGIRLDAVAGDVEGRVLWWRATDAALAEDVRHMRPLPPAPLVSGAATVLDNGIDAEQWYGYRACVEAPSGLRSQPTEPLWIRG